ncbi:MAG: DNA polymerase [Pseudomonadota bacterium]
MPYFLTARGKAGEFVEKYTELAKATKMLTGFVNSFPQYFQTGPVGQTVILPQYNFKNNTKRSQSSSPNGQNMPKRGKWAKHFRRCITAAPGKVLVASDLSQAELRIAAWMAGEREMMRIYQEDGDIHTITAAMAMGIADEAFQELASSEKKLKRFQAKASRRFNPTTEVVRKEPKCP